MASVDLKHACFIVPVRELDQDLLQFEYKNLVFQFTVLPIGFTSSPRIFTKITKPNCSALREFGHIVVAYIDDTYFKENPSKSVKRM